MVTLDGGNLVVFYYIFISVHLKSHLIQVQIQDFKLGGGGLKKIAPSGERGENSWGISCEKARFYGKKSYFFQS